ncbi:hypothetical protein Egran_04635 [Elaphomyces granulatus]|uniref:UBC core domain-containing protein n=1 Tax=Elaphomyces granulatus TaxID=519963 RepID=A0A232LTV7_9EURO|nr:hypothetical protein Egran_04635 [Elaphomyces granulatus]
MSSYILPNIPSLRRHQLLLEFASLKHAPPPGVYMSLTPGDPMIWAGVLFVQNGPYASAILRFQIRFPPSYPDVPPVVIFTTDIFHPLLVPLTTYTFTTGSSSEDPVSARDEERLPPGGFSLRHGFPRWFVRARRSITNSAASSRNASGSGSIPTSTEGESAGANNRPTGDTNTENKPPNDQAGHSTPSKAKGTVNSGLSSNMPHTDNNLACRVSPALSASPYAESKVHVPVVVLLEYIRSTFEDAAILDALPLDAAGNPGAWHAWRAHRRSVRGVKSEPRRVDGEGSSKVVNPQARLPGEWNWEGVWAKRVRNGIEASQSDSMLFGNAPRNGGDDLIRFFNADDATLSSIKEKIIPPADETLV